MIKFDHPNVISLNGVALGENGEPHLIIPFMKNGNLLDYLRMNSGLIPVVKLLSICRDVALGLQYLTNLNIVHGDLACRNYLISDDHRIVISDFGLTKTVNINGYYVSSGRLVIPFKYVAPESMHGKFSAKSDIWSFGITMWEIFSGGEEPYARPEGILRDDADTELLGLLASGKRLLKPQQCPLSVYKLMLSCWKLNRKERPSPSDIIAVLKNELEVPAKLEQPPGPSGYKNFDAKLNSSLGISNR